MDVAGTRVVCTRLSYTGELGFELFVPGEDAAAVYDVLVSAGWSHGLTHAGLKALSSLRLEKAYRDYGHDIDNTDGIVEAGLGWAVDRHKPGGFLGREVAIRNLDSGPPLRRLVQVLLEDPEPLMFHGEVVAADGEPVGFMRSAAFGFTLGGAVGLAMVEPGCPVTGEFLRRARWEVDVAGTSHPARVSLRPMYDPASRRPRS